MKKTLTFLASLALVGGLGVDANAHGATKPQHGGIVQMNGETLFELVRGPTGVSLYLIDEDDPVPASSVTATLNINDKGKKTTVPLAAGKGNQFYAKGLKVAPGSSVGVQVIDKANGAHFGTTFIIK